ncbi:MAG: hypothetical protein HY698_02620 [Deltaproteobacteria bacterium]|nr:hypothetical protein [Deltaproteobacteria bacterium]
MWRKAAVITTLVLLTIGARQAPRIAQAVGDLPSPSSPDTPSVLILFDTSANQYENLGNAPVPNLPLAGYKGPVKRYMPFQLALTGEFEDSLKKRWISTSPGLLDRYRDEIRFGMAGIDGKMGTGTTKADGYSYGESFPGLVRYEWTATGMTTLGGTASLVNQGMQGRDAPDFPLLPIYRTSDMRADNDYIQSNLMATAFAANRDGLMDVFRDAAWYWRNDFPTAVPAGGDCGDKYVLYLLGGEPGRDFSHAVNEVTKLYKEQNIKTYVVALVDNNMTVAKQDLVTSYANALAKAGGGTCANSPDVWPEYEHCAFVARGGTCSGDPANCDVAGVTDLTIKLGTVLSIIVNQVTSRTRLSTAGSPILAGLEDSWRISAHFQAMVRGGAWRGFLRARQVNVSGTVTKEISFDGKLNARPASDRTIYSTDRWGTLALLSSVLSIDYAEFVEEKRTYFEGAGKPCIAEAFFASPTRWHSMLSGASTVEVPPPASCASSVDGFLVSTFQEHKLGDIYHSSPVAVPPPEYFLNDPSYQEFMLAHKDRPTMVYVGSNDGMLHAFTLRHNDTTKEGHEAWAFVPRPVIEKLPNRIFGPELTVDSTVTVRDVQLPRSSRSASPWKTILVGSLGRGGPYVFALDVTDPDHPLFLWEFTDPLLGKPLAAPALGRVFEDKVERPVVFLSGGWDPGGVLDGKAFFVLDAITGRLLKRFSNLDSGTVDVALDAAMSGAPTAYEDQPTTFTTRVFAGDLKGRMWRIDVSSSLAKDWKMTRFFPLAGDPEHDVTEFQKPIFLAPAVALDFARRPVIYYGTGNLEVLDTAEASFFWGIREELGPDEASTRRIGKLLPDSSFPLRLGLREKLTGDAVVWNGAVMFSTFTPSSGSCGFGEGKFFGVDYLTGKPRLTSAGKLTFSGDASAVSYLPLGPGVPSAPLIRQVPASVSFNARGDANVAGGNFQALVQTGATVKTDELVDTTLAIDLGTIQRRADILSIVEIE